MAPQRRKSRKRNHADNEPVDNEPGVGTTSEPPVDETVLPRFTMGANHHFNDIIDLSGLPAELQARITTKAPFVLGTKAAVYDKKFFQEVAGLCASGPHPVNVTEDKMPRTKWGCNWGNAVDDPSFRIWLKDADDDIAHERYQSLYTSVYGNKPDNGGLANFFIRAATYYLEENEPVDWAAFALEVYRKRFAKPELNPQKLLPPCLTKQVQGMVDELGATITILQTLNGFKILAADGLDSVKSSKLKLASTKKDQVQAMNEVFRLKSLVEIELGEALVKNNKAEACHTADLELLFENKKEAQSRGDTKYVEFAKGQITAIAHTVCDVAAEKQKLLQEVDVNQAKLKVAEREVNIASSSISDAKCDLLDTISRVGLFPKHALRKLPLSGAEEMLCPYCSRLYVQNAYVPLSCGCCYHPPCMQALILSGHKNCLACGDLMHGIWMAYWGFPLDKEMSKEVEEFTANSLKDDQWVDADRAIVGGPSCFHELEMENNLSLIPYSP